MEFGQGSTKAGWQAGPLCSWSKAQLVWPAVRATVRWCTGAAGMVCAVCICACWRFTCHKWHRWHRRVKGLRRLSMGACKQCTCRGLMLVQLLPAGCYFGLLGRGSVGRLQAVSRVVFPQGCCLRVVFRAHVQQPGAGYSCLLQSACQACLGCRGWGGTVPNDG